MPQGESGILPLHRLSDNEEQGGDSNGCDEKQQLENDLTDLIVQLPISEPLSADEQIRCDDNEEYGEEASVKDIVDVVNGVGAVDESDSELKKEVSTSNALECITTHRDRYSWIYNLNKLKKAIAKKHNEKKNKRILNNFLFLNILLLCSLTNLISSNK